MPTILSSAIVCRVLGLLVFVVSLAGLADQASAQNADALMRLLRSGRLPAERLPNVIDAVTKRGSAEDLGFLLSKCAETDGFPAEARSAALLGLADAAEARGVLPAAEPQLLAGLLTDSDPTVRLSAIRLAGEWKDESFIEPLVALVADQQSKREAQYLFGSLSQIGSESCLAAIRSALNHENVMIASEAAGAFAASASAEAQQTAVEWLISAPAGADIAPVVRAFLARQGGAEDLASRLQNSALSQDGARLVLRTIYAAGRSDESLVAFLTERAGLQAESEPWTAERMASEVELVLTQGDPARGEAVFRRADLNCFNCHALSGAGGQVGPELGPVGASSPPDYLIHAIINPAQDVKEVYTVHKVMTIDGLLVSGVKVSESAETLVLRDAEGKTHVIPQEDIDASVEGGSLMPSGLKVLMTDQEFHDLIAFLSVLGKPGPYVVRSRNTVQRWKVTSAKMIGLTEAVAGTSDGMQVASQVPLDTWPSLYAKVAGGLPLEEVASAATDEEGASQSLFLRAELNVVVAGEVGFVWQGPEAEIWIDQTPWTGNDQSFALEPGNHTLTVRLKSDQCVGDALGEFIKPAGSSIDFGVVGGL